MKNGVKGIKTGIKYTAECLLLTFGEKNCVCGYVAGYHGFVFFFVAHFLLICCSLPLCLCNVASMGITDLMVF